MRFSIRTTVSTYALLSLAGAVAFIMPESIAPPSVVPPSSTLQADDVRPDGEGVVRAPAGDAALPAVPAA